MVALGTIRSLPQLAQVSCFDCLDTSVAVTLYGPKPCASCATVLARKLSPAAERFADTVWFRVGRKQHVDGQTLNIGRLLVHSTFEQPISRETFEMLMGLNDRKVKSVVEELRKEWVFPIGSNRNQPAGYYFIATEEDFLNWSRPYRSQAITSLGTVYRLQRKHFPRLCGQGEFDFLSLVNEELKEELR